MTESQESHRAQDPPGVIRRRVGAIDERFHMIPRLFAGGTVVNG